MVPDQLLGLLPGYIDSLSDYRALLLVSKHWNAVLTESASGPDLLRICYRSRWSLLWSDRLLLSRLARPLADWAAESLAHRDRLKAVLPYGASEILRFAVYTPAVARKDAGRWSLLPQALKAISRWKQVEYRAVEYLIDWCIGASWHDVDNFWDGGASDAATIRAKSSDVFYVLSTYGELFGRFWDDWLEANAAREQAETVEQALERTTATKMTTSAAAEEADGFIKDPLLNSTGRITIRTDFLKYLDARSDVQPIDSQGVLRRGAGRTDYRSTYPPSDDVSLASPVQSACESPGSFMSAAYSEADHMSDDDIGPLATYFVDPEDAEPSSPTTPSSDGLPHLAAPAAGQTQPPEEDPASAPGTTFMLDPLYLVRDSLSTGLPDQLPGNGSRRTHPQEVYTWETCEGIDHLIKRSPRWRRLLRFIRESAGGELMAVPEGPRIYDLAAWRQHLWEDCFYLLGDGGITILAQVYKADRAAERVRARAGLHSERESYHKKTVPGLKISTVGPAWDTLRRWRAHIANLKVRPRVIRVPTARRADLDVYEVPCLSTDIDVLLRGGPHC